MKYQIKYFLIKNKDKKLIKVASMRLCSNLFKEEEYDSGNIILVINGIKIQSGAYLEKKNMHGSFRMLQKTDVAKENLDTKKDIKNIFEAFFSLVNINKTCFTFLFYDNIYISIEIERLVNDFKKLY